MKNLNLWDSRAETANPVKRLAKLAGIMTDKIFSFSAIKIY